MLNFMSTSSTLRARLLDDELWLDKLTVLANLYPGLAHLEQGGGESVFSEHARAKAQSGVRQFLVRLQSV